jgi:chemotaxis protein MotA
VIQVIGSIVVVGCVIGGFLLDGGHFLTLWHPTEILIIAGAASGAFLTANPPKLTGRTVLCVLGCIKGPRFERQDYVALLKALYEILVRVRKQGMLSLERRLEDRDAGGLFDQYPQITNDRELLDFIRDCLRLMASGNVDARELEDLLEQEIEVQRERVFEPVRALEKAADGLPGFGIVAAVLGIVNTMGAIQGADTVSIGHKVGAALVGTFLGILVSYGFVGPIAAAIGHRAREETRAYEVVKMAFVASMRGYTPVLAIEFARKLLCSNQRPTFRHLEAELRGRVKAAA